MDAGDVATRPVPARRDASSRGLAVLLVLGSGLLALPFAPAAISLVREQLHIRCGMGPPGSEGADTWTCSDGIGYLGAAVTLGGMWLIAVLVGSLIAGLVRRDLVARIALVLLALMATAWVLGWTWYGSNELVGDAYSPMTGPEYWVTSVGFAALASAAAFAAGLGSLLLAGRAARVACAAAAIGLAAATVLQPGLGINTVPAAGLLAAAALMTQPAKRG